MVSTLEQTQVQPYKMEQDRVSGEVILSWLAAPVVMFHGHPLRFGNNVKVGTKV